LGEKHQIREHRKLLGLGNTPLSTIASKLELAYPRHTPWEISEMAREILLENGEGPDSFEVLSRAASMSADPGMSISILPDLIDTSSHHISRAQSVKLENSPKTPTVSLQALTFLNASEKQPSSHSRQATSHPFQPPEPIQEIPSYDLTVNYATPLRTHYDQRDMSVFDPGFFTQV
jgi:hypothetical protein